MNLRIETGELRFRISKEELESLCDGKALATKIFLPGQHVLSIEITTQDQPEVLLLVYQENHFSLQVQTDVAKDFYASLPSREGITLEQKIDDEHNLRLMLEVDIRTQKRRQSAP